MNKPEFAGKVAFVTGPGSGIGRATAIAFAEAGANITVADISEKNLEATVAQIEARGGRVVSARCDVTKAAEVKGALDKTVQTLGRLDVAFNNAGIEQPVTPIAELTEEVGRIGRPEEIADAVLWLCSERGAL